MWNRGKIKNNIDKLAFLVLKLKLLSHLRFKIYQHVINHY
jgi:hypothetical protein